MPKSNFSRWLPVLLAGAALVVPVIPALAVTDFQLPPSNTRPRAQGPVDAGETPPRTATPSPRPSPTPAPAPSSPVPVITVPPAATPVTAPSRTPPPARPTTAPQTAAPSAVPSVQPSEVPSAAPTAPAILPSVQPGQTPSVTPAPAAEQASPATPALPAWWPWAAGGAALLAILGGLAVLLLRRRREHMDTAPEIERPVVQRPPVAPQAAPTPAAAPEPAPPHEAEPEHGPLSMAMEARALTISFGAATLAYRITLTNTGRTPLGGVEISGDMVSAHASLSLEDQLATPEAPLAPAHAIERIRPGESVQVNGEFRLPLQAIRPIMQGGERLLVPLARLRIHAAQGGNGALIKTALVGQRANRPGAGLQPFRLDLGPRIYREVTQKIF